MTGFYKCVFLSCALSLTPHLFADPQEEILKRKNEDCFSQHGSAYSWSANKNRCQHDFESKCDALYKKIYIQNRYDAFMEDLEYDNSLKTIAYSTGRKTCQNISDYLDYNYYIPLINFAIKDLRPLMGFQKLEILDLTNTLVEDNSLIALSVLPKLRIVNLTYTRVTSQGIRRLLGSNKSVREIIAVDLNNRDLRAIKEVMEEFPNVRFRL